jgi:hypothetical protein
MSRLSFTSNARPEGPSHGLSEYFFVFDVQVDLALAVGGRALRLARHRDRARHGSGLGVDGGDVLRSSVEREYAAGDRVVLDRIGVFARRHLAGRLEGLQVEHRDVVAATVADEPAVQRRDDRDAVDAGRVGNIAHDFARVQIGDDHMGIVGDVQTPGAAVDGHVVPAALAADLDFAEDVISGGRRENDRHGDQQEHQQFSHLLLHVQ